MAEGSPAQGSDARGSGSRGSGVATLLDTIGLACPLPVLKTRKALTSLAAGDVLEVLASDPGTAADLEAFCRMTGHRLLGQTSEAGVSRFLIEKAGSNGEHGG